MGVVEQATEVANTADAKYAIEKAGGAWHEEKSCLSMILFLLLVTLLILAGCGGDDYNGGGKSDGGGDGDYETYWGVTEVFSTKGYIPEMTQKQEPPAPKSDQEDCPTVMLLLLVLWEVYIIGVMVSKQKYKMRFCTYDL